MANIREFKVGDIVTRNAPCGTDGSWTGERLIFKGHDENSKIIFLEPSNKYSDIFDISYAKGAWDEGWCLYPETMWQKVKRNLTE